MANNPVIEEIGSRYNLDILYRQAAKPKPAPPPKP